MKGTVTILTALLTAFYCSSAMAAAKPDIIRKGDWKLVKFWAGPRELFDLSTDLGEEKNLAPDRPEKVGELDSMLMQRLTAGGARLPRKNPDFVPQDATKPPRE